MTKQKTIRVTLDVPEQLFVEYPRPWKVEKGLSGWYKVTDSNSNIVLLDDPDFYDDRDRSFVKTIAQIGAIKKKPVVIEAMQFNGLDDYLKIVEWMKSTGHTRALANEIEYRTPIMLVPTLEGTMAANPGDWIIRGVRNEFYPCKPDIFAATYEPVE